MCKYTYLFHLNNILNQIYCARCQITINLIPLTSDFNVCAHTDEMFQCPGNLGNKSKRRNESIYKTLKKQQKIQKNTKNPKE